MKRLSPTTITLLLAHLLASYCAFIPTFFTSQPRDSGHLWICLAPILTPIFLIATTLSNFPHYYDSLTQVWVCYTIPFVIVCLIRHKTTPILKLVTPPILITLFVTALWLPRAIAEFTPWHSPLQGQPAPDFTLTTLTGTPHTLSHEKGHVILIDFWAVWCPQCLAELKQTTSKLAADPALYQQGLRVWTINTWEDAYVAQQFMDKNHYDFDVMIDPKNAATKYYRSEGIPITYIVARDGTIQKAYLGFQPDTDQQLRTEINEALK